MSKLELGDPQPVLTWPVKLRITSTNVKGCKQNQQAKQNTSNMRHTWFTRPKTFTVSSYMKKFA